MKIAILRADHLYNLCDQKIELRYFPVTEFQLIRMLENFMDWVIY